MRPVGPLTAGDEGTGIEWDTPNEKSDGNSSCCKEALDAVKATLGEANLKRDIILGLEARGFHFKGSRCWPLIQTMLTDEEIEYDCSNERYELDISNRYAIVTIVFEGFESAYPLDLRLRMVTRITWPGQYNTCVTSKSYAEFMAKTNNLAKIDELIKEIKDSLKVSDH